MEVKVEYNMQDTILVRNLNSEVICDYEVSEKMKKVWNVELNNLVEFQRICEKFGLSYYAIAGTLLGAIRHKGFIPWDDDIDIGMPRKDYQRFLEVAPKELKSPLFLQTYKSERCFSSDMARLRNSNTTGFTTWQGLNKTNKGIFIDIFPIDNEPDDEAICRIEDKKHKRQIHFISATSKVGNYTGLKGAVINTIRKLLMVLVSNSMKEHWMERVIADVSKYNDESTQYCGLRSFPSEKRFRWKNEDCKEFVEVPFEKVTILAPKGYDSILRSLYGDYQVFVKGSSNHEGVVFEPDIPYEVYCREHKLVL